MMPMSDHAIRDLSAGAADRRDFWVAFVDAMRVAVMAEVGVYRGAFAERVLDECDSIRRYFMIDPWRHLDDWNKPANKDDDAFEQLYAEALDKTEAHAEKRVVLRGRTIDVIDQIPDGALDLAYIDGDHTLRGITLDLATVYPKVRAGGWIGGDDFCRSIFQHSSEFEPTLVFPYAVYFAEAVRARIYALPHRQFLLEKSPPGRFEFVDLTGRYGDTTLHAQLTGRRPRAPTRQPAHPPAAAPTSIRGVLSKVAAKVRER
jgi:Methyltransferase domain